jgi:hypothetical protein
MVGDSAVGRLPQLGPEQAGMRTRTPAHVNVGSALGSGRCAAEFVRGIRKTPPARADVHPLIVADLRHLPVTGATARDSASAICCTGPSHSSGRRGHRTTDHTAAVDHRSLVTAQHPVSLSRACLVL